MSDPVAGTSFLRTEKLTKIYPDGHVNALVDVSIDIRHGEYVAIMGPSGCGKSTLLNLLGILDRPTSGEIFLDGQSLTKVPDADHIRATKLGFIFQSFYLLPTLNALENVQIPMFEGPLPGPERVKKAAALLQSVGMSHRADHLPFRLSGGERQRVAIARSLANDPVLLLADEPTGNLDSTTTKEVLELFGKLHRERQMTVVVITHSQEVAERAQRILRMRDGKVVDDGMSKSKPS